MASSTYTHGREPCTGGTGERMNGEMHLDEVERFAEIDRCDALGDVEAAPQQWSMARLLGPSMSLSLDGIDHIVIAGMGGSGISGDVVAQVADGPLSVPVHVHKGYGLPGFTGRRTLVLAVSHSGETEETLSAFEAARRRGARIFAVTSGGTLGAQCDEAGLPWVKVPVGGQPRHSLGLLVVPLLIALGLDGDFDAIADAQRQVVASCGREVPTVRNPAKALATRLASSVVPVVYGSQGVGAVGAYRLKCQLNENAELPVLWGQVPEVSHNDQAAWRSDPASAASFGVVWVRDAAGEHPRLAERVAATSQLTGDRFAWQAELSAPERGPLAARLAAVLLTADLVSVYTALALGRDPTPIAGITALKQRLVRDPASGCFRL